MEAPLHAQSTPLHQAAAPVYIGVAARGRCTTMLLVTVAAVTVASVALVAAAVAVDTTMVGSSVHEARVAAPPDLQTAAAGDSGYHHTHKTRGGDG